MLLAVGILATAVLGYILLWYRNIRELPPGPWGLPIVGYLPFFGTNMYVAVKELQAKYGEICSVKLGAHTVIFINDTKLIRKVLIDETESFSGRPLEMYSFNGKNFRKGIVPNDGEDWKVIRRLSMTLLRDFGMGRQAIEVKVKQETLIIIDSLERQMGKPIMLRRLLMNAVANIICSMVFGYRFEYEEPEFRKLMDLIIHIFESVSAHTSLLNWMPYLKHLPHIKKSIAKDWQISENLWLFTRPRVMEHKAKVAKDPNRPSEDFLDGYLKEMKNCGETNPAKAKLLDESLLYTVTQIFLAGSETTSTTLEWGILLMILNPHVQQKVQKELDSVVGRERLPAYEDHNRLPYVDACIREIHRLAILGPILLPHSNFEEQYISGYRIPKRSTIFCSTSLSCVNPKLFPDPLTFKPERFILPDGKIDTNLVSFMPYGGGKSYCYPKIEDRRPGLTCRPPNYEVIAEKRDFEN